MLIGSTELRLGGGCHSLPLPFQGGYRMALENPKHYSDRVNSTHRLDKNVKEALSEAVRIDPQGRTVSDIVNDALRAYPDVAKHIR